MWTLGPELISVEEHTADFCQVCRYLRGKEHHLDMAGTKLHCVLTDAHRCEQVDLGYQPGLEVTQHIQDRCKVMTKKNP